MNRQGSRRRVRKRKTPRENSRMNLSWILGIMVLAVLLGYLTARFVVGPLIGYDADESPTKVAGQTDEEDGEQKDAETGKEDADADGKNEDGESVEDKEVSAAPADGYALQFGAFSTKEAAEKLAQTLKDQGIETEIVEIDSVFKVISPVVDTKEEALESLEKISDSEAVSDVFVAAF